MGRTGKRIKLTDNERAELKRFVSTGKHSSRLVRRAQIVLALDSSGDAEPARQGDVAARFGVSRATVSNVKRDFEEGGPDRLLSRKKRETPPVPPKADGEFEAHLIALSCTEPPPGYDRWTVRLLADKCIELEYIGSVSYSTVSRVLKKRAQAPLERLLVHSSNAKCRVRRGDGGCPRSV